MALLIHGWYAKQRRFLVEEPRVGGFIVAVEGVGPSAGVPARPSATDLLAKGWVGCVRGKG
jgi:hypothetical protein